MMNKFIAIFLITIVCVSDASPIVQRYIQTSRKAGKRSLSDVKSGANGNPFSTSLTPQPPEIKRTSLRINRRLNTGRRLDTQSEIEAKINALSSAADCEAQYQADITGSNSINSAVLTAAAADKASCLAESRVKRICETLVAASSAYKTSVEAVFSAAVANAGEDIPFQTKYCASLLNAIYLALPSDEEACDVYVSDEDYTIPKNTFIPGYCKEVGGTGTLRYSTKQACETSGLSNSHPICTKSGDDANGNPYAEYTSAGCVAAGCSGPTCNNIDDPENSGSVLTTTLEANERYCNTSPVTLQCGNGEQAFPDENACGSQARVGDAGTVGYSRYHCDGVPQDGSKCIASVASASSCADGLAPIVEDDGTSRCPQIAFVNHLTFNLNDDANTSCDVVECQLSAGSGSCAVNNNGDGCDVTPGTADEEAVAATTCTEVLAECCRAGHANYVNAQCDESLIVIAQDRCTPHTIPFATCEDANPVLECAAGYTVVGLECQKDTTTVTACATDDIDNNGVGTNNAGSCSNTAAVVGEPGYHFVTGVAEGTNLDNRECYKQIDSYKITVADMAALTGAKYRGRHVQSDYSDHPNADTYNNHASAQTLLEATGSAAQGLDYRVEFAGANLVTGKIFQVEPTDAQTAASEDGDVRVTIASGSVANLHFPGSKLIVEPLTTGSLDGLLCTDGVHAAAGTCGECRDGDGDALDSAPTYINDEGGCVADGACISASDHANDEDGCVAEDNGVFTNAGYTWTDPGGTWTDYSGNNKVDVVAAHCDSGNTGAHDTQTKCEDSGDCSDSNHNNDEDSCVGSCDDGTSASQSDCEQKGSCSVGADGVDEATCDSRSSCSGGASTDQSSCVGKGSCSVGTDDVSAATCTARGTCSGTGASGNTEDACLQSAGSCNDSSKTTYDACSGAYIDNNNQAQIRAWTTSATWTAATHTAYTWNAATWSANGVWTDRTWTSHGHAWVAATSQICEEGGAGGTDLIAAGTVTWDTCQTSFCDDSNFADQTACEVAYCSEASLTDQASCEGKGTCADAAGNNLPGGTDNEAACEAILGQFTSSGYSFHNAGDDDEQFPELDFGIVTSVSTVHHDHVKVAAIDGSTASFHDDATNTCLNREVQIHVCAAGETRQNDDLGDSTAKCLGAAPTCSNGNSDISDCSTVGSLTNACSAGHSLVCSEDGDDSKLSNDAHGVYSCADASASSCDDGVNNDDQQACEDGGGTFTAAVGQQPTCVNVHTEATCAGTHPNMVKNDDGDQECQRDASDHHCQGAQYSGKPYPVHIGDDGEYCRVDPVEITRCVVGSAKFNAGDANVIDECRLLNGEGYDAGCHYSSCKVNEGGREVSDAACNAPVGQWQAGSCKAPDGSNVALDSLDCEQAQQFLPIYPNNAPTSCTGNGPAAYAGDSFVDYFQGTPTFSNGEANDRGVNVLFAHSASPISGDSTRVSNEDASTVEITDAATTDAQGDVPIIEGVGICSTAGYVSEEACTTPGTFEAGYCVSLDNNGEPTTTLLADRTSESVCKSKPYAISAVCENRHRSDFAQGDLKVDADGNALFTAESTAQGICELSGGTFSDEWCVGPDGVSKPHFTTREACTFKVVQTGDAETQTELRYDGLSSECTIANAVSGAVTGLLNRLLRVNGDAKCDEASPDYVADTLCGGGRDSSQAACEDTEENRWISGCDRVDGSGITVTDAYTGVVEQDNIACSSDGSVYHAVKCSINGVLIDDPTATPAVVGSCNGEAGHWVSQACKLSDGVDATPSEVVVNFAMNEDYQAGSDGVADANGVTNPVEITVGGVVVKQIFWGADSLTSGCGIAQDKIRAHANYAASGLDVSCPQGSNELIISDAAGRAITVAIRQDVADKITDAGGDLIKSTTAGAPGTPAVYAQGGRQVSQAACEAAAGTWTAFEYDDFCSSDSNDGSACGGCSDGSADDEATCLAKNANAGCSDGTNKDKAACEAVPGCTFDVVLAMTGACGNDANPDCSTVYDQSVHATQASCEAAGGGICFHTTWLNGAKLEQVDFAQQDNEAGCLALETSSVGGDCECVTAAGGATGMYCRTHSNYADAETGTEVNGDAYTFPGGNWCYVRSSDCASSIETTAGSPWRPCDINEGEVDWFQTGGTTAQNEWVPPPTFVEEVTFDKAQQDIPECPKDNTEECSDAVAVDDDKQSYLCYRKTSNDMCQDEAGNEVEDLEITIPAGLYCNDANCDAPRKVDTAETWSVSCHSIAEAMGDGKYDATAGTGRGSIGRSILGIESTFSPYVKRTFSSEQRKLSLDVQPNFNGAIGRDTPCHPYTGDFVTISPALNGQSFDVHGSTATRDVRARSSMEGGLFVGSASSYKTGDKIVIYSCDDTPNNGEYTIDSVAGDTITLEAGSLNALDSAGAANDLNGCKMQLSDEGRVLRMIQMQPVINGVASTPDKILEISTQAKCNEDLATEHGMTVWKHVVHDLAKDVRKICSKLQNDVEEAKFDLEKSFRYDDGLEVASKQDKDDEAFSAAHKAALVAKCDEKFGDVRMLSVDAIDGLVSKDGATLKDTYASLFKSKETELLDSIEQDIDDLIASADAGYAIIKAEIDAKSVHLPGQASGGSGLGQLKIALNQKLYSLGCTDFTANGGNIPAYVDDAQFRAFGLEVIRECQEQKRFEQSRCIDEINAAWGTTNGVSSPTLTCDRSDSNINRFGVESQAKVGDLYTEAAAAEASIQSKFDNGIVGEIQSRLDSLVYFTYQVADICSTDLYASGENPLLVRGNFLNMVAPDGHSTDGSEPNQCNAITHHGDGSLDTCGGVNIRTLSAAPLTQLQAEGKYEAAADLIDEISAEIKACNDALLENLVSEPGADSNCPADTEQLADDLLAETSKYKDIAELHGNEILNKLVEIKNLEDANAEIDKRSNDLINGCKTLVEASIDAALKRAQEIMEARKSEEEQKASDAMQSYCRVIALHDAEDVLGLCGSFTDDNIDNDFSKNQKSEWGLESKHGRHGRHLASQHPQCLRVVDMTENQKESLVNQPDMVAAKKINEAACVCANIPHQNTQDDADAKTANSNAIAILEQEVQVLHLAAEDSKPDYSVFDTAVPADAHVGCGMYLFTRMVEKLDEGGAGQLPITDRLAELATLSNELRSVGEKNKEAEFLQTMIHLSEGAKSIGCCPIGNLHDVGTACSSDDECVGECHGNKCVPGPCPCTADRQRYACRARDMCDGLQAVGLVTDVDACHGNTDALVELCSNCLPSALSQYGLTFPFTGTGGAVPTLDAGLGFCFNEDAPVAVLGGFSFKQYLSTINDGSFVPLFTNGIGYGEHSQNCNGAIGLVDGLGEGSASNFPDYADYLRHGGIANAVTGWQQWADVSGNVFQGNSFRPGEGPAGSDIEPFNPNYPTAPAARRRLLNQRTQPKLFTSKPTPKLRHTVTVDHEHPALDCEFDSDTISELIVYLFGVDNGNLFDMTGGLYSEAKDLAAGTEVDQVHGCNAANTAIAQAEANKFMFQHSCIVPQIGRYDASFDDEIGSYFAQSEVDKTVNINKVRELATQFRVKLYPQADLELDLCMYNQGCLLKREFKGACNSIASNTIDNNLEHSKPDTTTIDLLLDDSDGQIGCVEPYVARLKEIAKFVSSEDYGDDNTIGAFNPPLAFSPQIVDYLARQKDHYDQYVAAYATLEAVYETEFFQTSGILETVREKIRQQERSMHRQHLQSKAECLETCSDHVQTFPNDVATCGAADKCYCRLLKQFRAGDALAYYTDAGVSIAESAAACVKETGDGSCALNTDGDDCDVTEDPNYDANVAGAVATTCRFDDFKPVEPVYGVDFECRCLDGGVFGAECTRAPTELSAEDQLTKANGALPGVENADLGINEDIIDVDAESSDLAGVQSKLDSLVTDVDQLLGEMTIGYNSNFKAHMGTLDGDLYGASIKSVTTLCTRIVTDDDSIADDQAAGAGGAESADRLVRLYFRKDTDDGNANGDYSIGGGPLQASRHSTKLSKHEEPCSLCD